MAPTARTRDDRRATARTARLRSRIPEPDEEPDLLGQYLAQIGATPLLTAEDEVRLATRIEAGVRAREELEAADTGEPAPTPGRRRALEETVHDGQEAKDHMVRANLRLVVSMAKRHAHRGLPLLDVIQEGNLGLIRAVEKFDAEKGFRFSTYAVWWIRQFISRGIAASRSTVKLPSRANDELLRLREMTTMLEQSHGRAPRPDELAEAAGLTEERVVELLRVGSDPVSLSGPVGDDGAELGDFVEDPTARDAVEGMAGRLLPEELDRILEVLDDREREIIGLRYGFGDDEPLSVAQVAERVGLSRERIRQLEHRALAKLMHPSWRSMRSLLVEA